MKNKENNFTIHKLTKIFLTKITSLIIILALNSCGNKIGNIKRCNDGPCNKKDCSYKEAKTSEFKASLKLLTDIEIKDIYDKLNNKHIDDADLKPKLNPKNTIPNEDYVIDLENDDNEKNNSINNTAVESEINIHIKKHKDDYLYSPGRKHKVFHKAIMNGVQTLFFGEHHNYKNQNLLKIFNLVLNNPASYRLFLERNPSDISKSASNVINFINIHNNSKDTVINKIDHRHLMFGRQLNDDIFLSKKGSEYKKDFPLLEDEKLDWDGELNNLCFYDKSRIENIYSMLIVKIFPMFQNFYKELESINTGLDDKAHLILLELYKDCVSTLNEVLINIKEILNINLASDNFLLRVKSSNKNPGLVKKFIENLDKLLCYSMDYKYIDLIIKNSDKSQVNICLAGSYHITHIIDTIIKSDNNSIDKKDVLKTINTYNDIISDKAKQFESQINDTSFGKTLYLISKTTDKQILSELKFKQTKSIDNNDNYKCLNDDNIGLKFSGDELEVLTNDDFYDQANLFQHIKYVVNENYKNYINELNDIEKTNDKIDLKKQVSSHLILSLYNDLFKGLETSKNRETLKKSLFLLSNIKLFSNSINQETEVNFYPDALNLLVKKFNQHNKYFIKFANYDEKQLSVEYKKRIDFLKNENKVSFENIINGSNSIKNDDNNVANKKDDKQNVNNKKKFTTFFNRFIKKKK